MRQLLCVATLLASTTALVAQLPYSSSILGVISPIAPSEGLYIADRAGGNVAVTGLVAAGSSNANVNAIALDPIDDRIWIGSSSTNQLNWIRITGTTVSQFSLFGTAPLTSINAITFDDNSNPIISQSTAASGGGVFRFDRKLGGAGVSIGSVATGTHNGVCRDPAGNLYIGMFTAAQVHKMLKNPDGSFQAPVLVGSTVTTSISGIAFAPNDGTNPDELWITTFGAAGSQMYRMPAAGGPGVAVANTLAGCNWIDYDRNFNDLLVSSQAGSDRFFQVDRTTGADTTLSTMGSGSVGTPASNDVDDTAAASTRIAPMILNGSLGPFDLELSTTAPAGTLALVGTVAPAVNVVGIGIVGANGRLSVSIPNITLTGPLAPGSLTFIAAYFDFSFNLVIGLPVPWPVL
ncbi:MAG TPA: hypothetical protein VFD82_09475 [Planctomycetota bacterium]|nr:hypothetical protein [Planctomycetota bacterium]